MTLVTLMIKMAKWHMKSEVQKRPQRVGSTQASTQLTVPLSRVLLVPGLINDDGHVRGVISSASLFRNKEMRFTKSTFNQLKSLVCLKS